MSDTHGQESPQFQDACFELLGEMFESLDDMLNTMNDHLESFVGELDKMASRGYLYPWEHM